MTVVPTIMDDIPELKQSQVNVGNGLPPLTKHESSPWFFSTTLYVSPLLFRFITGGPSGESRIEINIKNTFCFLMQTPKGDLY